MSRRALILAGLLASVAAVVVAGCGSKGTVAPVPNTVEGSVPKTTTTTTTTTGPTLKGDPAAGKTVFTSAGGCTACHTLKAANATGTIGPNLDDAKPPEALVVDRVTNGKGVMPSFKGKLSSQQIADVAAFVSQSAGG